ncbi:MAG: histone-lysine N-methyltransferase [bacterium]|nr:histone-lysine N-methyltransferase [bacterium]
MIKTLLKNRRKKHELRNVDKPELYRDIFPYNEAPRIKFDYMHEPFDIPDEIWITDTTFRDGQQAMPPYSVKQIGEIFDLLHKLGGPNGVIRFSEFFLYSDKDKEAVEKCLSRNYQFPEVTGWIRANKKDFELVKKMGLKETGILTSCSDYHIFLKLNSNRKAVLEGYLDVVQEALKNNIIPRCHFEDVTRADIYGFVIPFAQKLMDMSQESKIPIKIRLCDTLGLGINYPGVELPRSIPKLFHTIIHEAGVPSKWLEWHGHNDFHKVHINTATAWLYGSSGANGTLLGFGERTGNAPIEALVFEYIGLKGNTNGIDTKVITEIAEYYRKLGITIPENYPFVGEGFNVTRAGIHADGVLKNPEIYTIFDTEKLLNIPIGIGITDKSGTAGIALWINSRFKLPDSMKIDKHHPGLLKIYEWVMNEYEAKRRTSAISDIELEYQSKKFIPELFESEFDEIKKKVKREVTDLIEQFRNRDEIVSMNKKEMEKFLDRVIQDYPFIQLIAITDIQGSRITRNITQIEDKHKYEVFTKDNFAERDWFINPIKTGKTYVSNFYVSKITNDLCITVSTPIFDKEEKKINGILEFDIRFEEAVKM